MEIILVGLKNKQNMRLLDGFFSYQFTMNEIMNDQDFNDYFDMLIVDNFYMRKYHDEITKLKNKKRFIPVMLLTSNLNSNDFMIFSQNVDEVIQLPISKLEMKFRINKLINLTITKEAEMKYKTILETDDVGICIIENDLIISYNSNFSNIFLLEKSVLNNRYQEVFSFGNGKLINKIDFFQKNDMVSKQFDQKVMINGMEKFLNFKLSTLGDQEYKNSIFMVILDITENINTIEEIDFLNKHDKLTGLYNRAFLDYYIKEIDLPNNLPISIIMADIDGLKLINDGFGHEKGDEAIINVANKIQQSCRNSDRVFRIGGDEFLIILPNTSALAAKNVMNRIQSLISETERLTCSISLGLSTKEHLHQKIQGLIIESENKMYQNKLVNGESHRHSFIESLEKVLQENTNETHDHAERMKTMVALMVKKLELNETVAHELNLLARLHDIGKVAIPASILKKPTQLTTEEWKIVKEHPAAGYRITKAIPHLAQVSQDILYHHEHWDGNGYPKGLKGTDIPFAARIIAIIDAYDVMTHERSYKKAYSPQEAIKELRRCAGEQFDPTLVEVFLEIIEGVDDELN